MEATLAKRDDELVELEGIKITRGEIELVKRVIFPKADDDELRLFFYECRRRGVHPMDRLIYPVKRAGRVAFQMGIDYLRAAAEETGRYVGQKPLQYGAMIKQGEINVPEWAEALVLRKDPETGEVADIPHRAYWKEYYPGEELGFMWRKMPMNQLGKCAEAGALRKAFPRKLGGLYINEEMEQAEAVPFTSIQEPQRKKPPEEGQTEKANTDTQKITTQIVNVTQKDGLKPDKKTPYTLYTITGQIGEDQKGFKTFDKKIAEIALKAKGTSQLFEIEFKIGQYGNDIVTMTEPEDENAQ